MCHESFVRKVPDTRMFHLIPVMFHLPTPHEADKLSGQSIAWSDFEVFFFRRVFFYLKERLDDIFSVWYHKIKCSPRSNRDSLFGGVKNVT